MRAGRLRTLATLRTLTQDVAQLYVGVSAKEETQEPDQLPGVMARSNVTVRARFRADVHPGMYLMCGDVAYLINSVRDPDQRRRDLVMAATEISGTPATYTPVIGVPYQMPVAVFSGLASVGTHSRVAEVRWEVEVAKIYLLDAPRKGDSIAVPAGTFTVETIVEGGDDGVILRLAVAKS